jgi:hypothetical protein
MVMSETRDLSKQNVVYEEQQEIDPFESFPKIIKMKRTEWGLTALSVSEMMGMNYDVFKGKCNGNRPATRDFVIAVCAILLMNSWETGEALRSHKSMFPAFDEDNDRDSCIINFLDKPVYTYSTPEILTELNDTLVAEGFGSLDIIDHRNRTNGGKKRDKPKSQYTILGYAFQMTASNGYALYGDQYDSLETEYGLDRTRCVGRMYIENRMTGEEFRLHYSSEGDAYMYDSQHRILPRHYKQLRNAGEYTPFFSKLRSRTMKYQRKLIDRLDDTRNYGERISANILDGKIHVFAEKYNYRFPEANEYYVMEYSKGIYTLYVYHRSAFMYLFMGEEAYKRNISQTTPTPFLKFDSLEQINAFSERKDVPYWQIDLIPLRKSAYKSLTEAVDKLRRDLAEGKRFIRNPTIIGDHGDEPGWICSFFSLEKEFECYHETDDYAGDVLCLGKEVSSFQLKDGTTVEISINDLLKAFELGFNDIEEICQVKRDRGKIEVDF